MKTTEYILEVTEARAKFPVLDKRVRFIKTCVLANGGGNPVRVTVQEYDDGMQVVVSVEISY